MGSPTMARTMGSLGVLLIRLAVIVVAMVMVIPVVILTSGRWSHPEAATAAAATTESSIASTGWYSSGLPPRYWPKYGGLRHVRLLDGMWDYGRLGSVDHPPTPQSFDSMDPTLTPTNPIIVDALLAGHVTNVPSCVDNAPPGYLGYRGVSFYRTHFEYDLTQAPARLVFQACSFYCRVWVNGVEVGDHRAGGYVAFVLTVPQQEQQLQQEQTQQPDDQPTQISPATNLNELIVLVDNRFNRTTAPLHERGDYWHYGGIMRSVELHAMPPTTSLQDVEDNADEVDFDASSTMTRRSLQLRQHQVDPSSSSSSSLSSGPTTLSTSLAAADVWPWRLYVIPRSLSTVQLTLHLTDPSYNSRAVSGKIAFDDGPFETFTTLPNATVNGVVDMGIMAVPDPKPWNVGDRNAHLHTVTVDLNGATVTERFGLRVFGIDDGSGRITVNGQVVKLVGWNHHTQWPESAASPTDQEMDDDIRLLMEAGTIFVRGAHYPQDPRWLDRLDEVGMVMWCETLGAGVSLGDTIDPTFMQHQTDQIHEMLDNALNHPSVMVWAFFNEGPSNHEEACGAYEQCVQSIKSRDDTRFVTWASNQQDNDRCLHAADVVSFNGYPGWYLDADPIEFWDHHAENIRNGIYPGSAGKPFLISETGAGGIYEWSHNVTPGGKWTLDYQNKIVDADVTCAIENPSISGITLWHFMDFKTFDDTENNTHCDYIPGVYPPLCSYINTNVSRPGGLNHKGAVDFWRRKKPIYDIVATRYNKTTPTHPTLPALPWFPPMLHSSASIRINDPIRTKRQS